jgi:hypothetical protein
MKAEKPDSTAVFGYTVKLHIGRWYGFGCIRKDIYALKTADNISAH